MIDYKYMELFADDSTSKRVTIEYDTTVVTNEELFNQEITLEESLCSEKELHFGSCEASVIKFKVANIVAPMINKWVTVKVYPDNHTDDVFMIGRYKVAEDKVTADRQWREVVAYDAMHDIINANVAGWYNTILPESGSICTMKQFRTSFMEHFGLQAVLPKGGLVNDSMTIARTIEPSELSGRDVAAAICEINGCFGHIGRDGRFYFIYLEQDIEGLYPANDLYPADDLYPKEVKTAPVGAKGSYISCYFEDHKATAINRLQIRREENDIGTIIGKGGDNCYIIEDNFLVYGKGSGELWEIANNIFNKITGIVYRPFSAEVKGNPCFEVGDPVRIVTKYELVEAYILQRTLKGIQALRDSYSAEGVEKYTEKVNGVHRSIVQLKGKSNVLERNIEETRLQIKDVEQGLTSTITQTASQIRTEVENVNKSLSSRITQNADSITAEVTRAKNEEGRLSASIKINADNIALKVTKGTISSEISQEAGLISISANRIRITSDYFKLTEDGKITATAGTIGGINISSDGISATNFSIKRDGTATFTGINITSGGGSFSTGFGVSGTAKNQFDNLVANNATIGSLIAQMATIEQLNATTANLQNLIAQKIDASTVKADYMEVKNWTSAGYIKADKISASSITSVLSKADYILAGKQLQSGEITATSVLTVGTSPGLKITASASWKTINVAGTNYTVLCQS